jgi:hypothetical protein
VAAASMQGYQNVLDVDLLRRRERWSQFVHSLFAEEKWKREKKFCDGEICDFDLRL